MSPSTNWLKKKHLEQKWFIWLDSEMEREIFKASKMFLFLFHRLLLIFYFWKEGVKVWPSTPSRPWAGLCCSSHGLTKASKEQQHCHWLFRDLPRLLNGHWRILAAAIGHVSWNAPINNQFWLPLCSSSFFLLPKKLSGPTAAAFTVTTSQEKSFSNWPLGNWTPTDRWSPRVWIQFFTSDAVLHVKTLWCCAGPGTRSPHCRLWSSSCHCVA